MKKRKKIEIAKIKPEEWPKYEIAKELGLFDQIVANGWGSISAKEAGRIGGLLTQQKRRSKQTESGEGEKDSNRILNERNTMLGKGRDIIAEEDRNAISGEDRNAMPGEDRNAISGEDRTEY